MSLTPLFKLPYRFDKSAYKMCFTNDFAFLSKDLGNLTFPLRIF